MRRQCRQQATLQMSQPSTAADAKPPTAPVVWPAMETTTTTTNLSWQASTDNVWLLDIPYCKTVQYRKPQQEPYRFNVIPHLPKNTTYALR